MSLTDETAAACLAGRGDRRNHAGSLGPSGAFTFADSEFLRVSNTIPPPPTSSVRVSASLQNCFGVSDESH
jgi:hypothetical protein